MTNARNQTSIDALQLEASAAGARQAFVCAYSSSAEFEAETIAMRRAAGAYGPSIQPHTLLMIVAAVAGAILLLAAFSQV